MNDSMKTTYNGIEIVYNEDKSRFEFTLRGRDRSAESLGKAKEAIDKPVKENTKPFERVDVFWRNYDGWQDAVVTSIADQTSYSTYVWIVCGRTRQKERLDSVWPKTPANVEKIKEYKECEKQLVNIRKRMDSIEKGMDKLVIPKEETE